MALFWLIEPERVVDWSDGWHHIDFNGLLDGLVTSYDKNAYFTRFDDVFRGVGALREGYFSPSLELQEQVLVLARFKKNISLQSNVSPLL